MGYHCKVHSVGIYINFTKAFDKVRHSILLRKLSLYNTEKT